MKNYFKITQKDWAPYVIPFAVFLLLTGPVQFFPSLTPYLYIAKTIITGLILWFFRDKYISDISLSKLSAAEWISALLCGFLALFLWIYAEGRLFQLEQKTFFNPFALGWSENETLMMIAIRIGGAAIIVPIMEELFWRSFLIRYLIKAEFLEINHGSFTWYSFTAVAVLFGLEHNRIIIGIIVGILYGLLVIKQKKLQGAIIAHAVTNLGLGIYVLKTGNWMFW